MSELQEFFGELEGQPHFADTVESAIAILNTYPIDAAFIEIRGFFDIGLIKYINRYFSDLRIVLLLDNEVEGVISAIRDGGFSVLKVPCGLRDLNPCLSEKYDRENGYYETERIYIDKGWWVLED